MLNIKFIRENPELVANKSEEKGYKVDINRILELDKEALEKLSALEVLREKRNKLSSGKKSQPSPEEIEQGKELRQTIVKQEADLGAIVKDLEDLIEEVPNIFPDDTPLGGEENNHEEKRWGDPRQDEVKDHLSWGENHELIDFERGAKVAGNKFYFLKGDLVHLELAVFQFALQLASKHGFTPITVPHLVNTKTVTGTGFNAKGDEQQIYKIEGEDLNLIATAEIPITGYHSDEILDTEKLPLLYVGLSPAYRMEAGAYGKFSKGLYRVHQFNKLELYVFCKPDDSEEWHKKLIALEEELCQALGLPYRLVRIAAGDLGMPAYKKFDIEYWSPAEKEYRELMSCSNVTDYQARRLNIRYRKDGKTDFVHTLNGTAAAFSRMAIALIENHQQENGAIMVPEALRPFMSGKNEIN